MNLLQNCEPSVRVSFAEAMQFLALWAAKHAVYKGWSCKTEVLQEPLFISHVYFLLTALLQS